MGSHATAKLFWGYDLAHLEGGNPWADDIEDGYVAIEQVLGIRNEPYEIRKAARDSFGVEFDVHCSYDYPCHVLAVSASLVRSYQGTATRIDPEVPSEWRALLDDAVMKLGLDVSRCGEPGWFICSVYG